MFRNFFAMMCRAIHTQELILNRALLLDRVNDRHDTTMSAAAVAYHILFEAS